MVRGCIVFLIRNCDIYYSPQRTLDKDGALSVRMTPLFSKGYRKQIGNSAVTTNTNQCRNTQVNCTNMTYFLCLQTTRNKVSK